MKHNNSYLYYKYIRDNKLDTSIISNNEEIIFTNSQIDEAYEYISKLKSNIRLDLHGVADTIKSNVKVGNDVSIISYVGKFSKNRMSAYNEIIDRLKN